MFKVTPMPKTKTVAGKKFEIFAEGFETKTSVDKAAKFVAPAYHTKIVHYQHEGINKRYYALYVRERAMR